MSFSYRDLKNDRQWKATCGLSEKDFVSLRDAFRKAYELLHGIGLEEAMGNLVQQFALGTYKDCLFFVLFQLRTGLTQDCLGPVFGMDGSSAGRNFHKYTAVLELALQQQQALPKRQFRSVKEFSTYLKEEKEITIDATEYPVERPVDQQKQKECYSGKKKTHP